MKAVAVLVCILALSTFALAKDDSAHFTKLQKIRSAAAPTSFDFGFPKVCSASTAVYVPGIVPASFDQESKSWLMPTTAKVVMNLPFVAVGIPMCAASMVTGAVTSAATVGKATKGLDPVQIVYGLINAIFLKQIVKHGECVKKALQSIITILTTQLVALVSGLVPKLDTSSLPKAITSLTEWLLGTQLKNVLSIIQTAWNTAFSAQCKATTNFILTTVTAGTAPTASQLDGLTGILNGASNVVTGGINSFFGAIGGVVGSVKDGVVGLATGNGIRVPFQEYTYSVYFLLRAINACATSAVPGVTGSCAYDHGFYLGSSILAVIDRDAFPTK